MAQVQMEYFLKKINNLIACLPARRNNPLKVLTEAFTRWNKSDLLPELSLKPINELETLMSSLNNSTAFGRDELDACTMKMAARHIHRPIRHITNLSITTGIFANKWKIAKLVPIYKGKGSDRLLPGSYKPIILLPLVAKNCRKSCAETVNETHGRKQLVQ